MTKEIALMTDGKVTGGLWASHFLHSIRISSVSHSIDVDDA